MPDLITPVAVAVAAALTVQPVPAPNAAPLDPCTLVTAVAPVGSPSCPLPVCR
jgi:hypothetical protein